MTKDSEYWNKQVKSPEHWGNLSGLGHSQLGRQRGLKGGKLGPASAGRRLSEEERRKIEAAMRASGELK